LLLVPVAQAAAAPLVHVNLGGSGTGKVSSVGGVFGLGEGSPPIECSGPPKTGVCEGEMSPFGEGYVSGLTATADPGSEFAGWIVEESAETVFCGENPKCLLGAPEGGFAEATALFEKEHTGVTGVRTLTITKSPSSSVGAGNGSVSSKPKGIKCGATCDEAVAAMYKNTPVELSAKPSTGSTFVEWTGACSGSSPTCTVPMSEDESVGAVFGGTSKEFSPAEALTVSKGESTGKGTVKGPGLGCEAECTSTVVLFQGPITEPKAKPGKTVVLKQAPAFGSAFSGWSGCDSEPEGNCQVAMETAREVTAEYEALPNKVLTVNKEYSKGNGSVSSKPKGIKCGTACTQAVANMPEGAAVELTAKPSSGTFVKWEGGDCEGSTNPVCTVTMNEDETTTAVFSDPSKALSFATTLTLEKDGSGLGTVKAAGLGCEFLCSSTSVVYQGPVTLPKPKPGKVVVLKAVSAPGSKAVEWSGCSSIDGEGNCVVEIGEANATVKATFDELE